MVLSLISGVYYPIDTLPHWLASIARMFPPAYVFESLRAQLQQQASPRFMVVNLALGLTLTLLYLFITYRFFYRVYRHNLRTGALARFNASI
jgi:ABC-2 type transport system permease protein